MIPLCDLQRQYHQLRGEIDAALQQVAASGRYILGPRVRQFEQALASYCEAEHAIGVGSGTEALHLALRGLGIGPGDEVITTAFSFIATSGAIGLVGATPVFVDIEPATFNLDPTLVEAAITPRTRAILPVHLYGQPCDMDAVMGIARTHGLGVIEDCAQAIGAEYQGRKVGTFGDAGCFSFFPSKNLGCCGDGGMVVTNDGDLYKRIEMLRRHGGRVKYYHEELGLNSRLDELQAAILCVKFAHLQRWTEQRRQHAYRYNRLLADVPEICRPAELSPRGTEVFTAQENSRLCCVYHQYTILAEDRDALQPALQASGVESAIYYPLPLHLQEVHAPLGYRPGAFPHAECIAGRCLSLPMFPELTATEQDAVAAAILSHLQRPKHFAA